MFSERRMWGGHFQKFVKVKIVLLFLHQLFQHCEVAVSLEEEEEEGRGGGLGEEEEWCRG